MAGNDDIRAFGDAIGKYVWEKFVQPKLSNVVRYYIATAQSAPSGGMIQVQRPFDNTVTVRAAGSASGLVAGDRCLVLVFGDASNAIALGDAELLSLGSGGGGGGGVTAQPLTATANGLYNAPSGRAYDPVRVAVPEPESYSGSYSVTSGVDADVTLATSGKKMDGDMTVKKIPVAEVSNASGGYTVTIGN